MDIKSITISEKRPKKSQFIDEKTKQKHRKRVDAEHWTFEPSVYEHINQLTNIKNIIENDHKFTDKITKTMMQQINKKIYGYKQQDIVKKLLNAEKLITFETVVNKMIECNLKCYYCCCDMDVLYSISREMKQWTVDRINNDLGHNVDNFYLACLECNLKRRRRSDDKFLFTKQMKLVKIQGVETDSSLV